ncbi:hypothetical protein HNQ05_001827 [Oceanithermus desulfurans]|uniref:Uncharacterized protein n=1 Tax=Oceanithermus desulfurans TaxID=227924 RepID=A0ABR6P366_9DEIN|nr:hypothetical protein [Oceanithermus desulfurans]
MGYGSQGSGGCDRDAQNVTSQGFHRPRARGRFPNPHPCPPQWRGRFVPQVMSYGPQAGAASFCLPLGGGGRRPEGGCSSVGGEVAKRARPGVHAAGEAGVRPPPMLERWDVGEGFKPSPTCSSGSRRCCVGRRPRARATEPFAARYVYGPVSSPSPRTTHHETTGRARGSVPTTRHHRLQATGYRPQATGYGPRARGSWAGLGLGPGFCFGGWFEFGGLG